MDECVLCSSAFYFNTCAMVLHCTAPSMLTLARLGQSRGSPVRRWRPALQRSMVLLSSLSLLRPPPPNEDWDTLPGLIISIHSSPLGIWVWSFPNKKEGSIAVTQAPFETTKVSAGVALLWVNISFLKQMSRSTALLFKNNESYKFRLLEIT